MKTRVLPIALAAASLLAALPLAAQPRVTELVELAPVTVTMTRSPTAPELVPAAISTITGEELRARGVEDLRTALSLSAGTSIATGGDGGPLGSQPGIRGLIEADDFLLVIDGVPIGGAFSPTTQTLDLHNVEKIEVLRGASPVLFGAISFAGIINVSHYAAGEAAQSVSAYGGTQGTGGVSMATVISKGGEGRIAQSLSAEVERIGFKDESEGRRAHLLYRTSGALAGGLWTADLDLLALAQRPASPTLFGEEEEGMVSGGEEEDEAEGITPQDINLNFSDARLRDHRGQLSAGYRRNTSLGDASVTLALTQTQTRNLRAFIDELDVEDREAEMEGSRLRRDVTDIYLDSHLESTLSSTLTLVSGVDWLHGSARQTSTVLDYDAPLNGPRVNSDAATADGSFKLGVIRDYFGAYTQARWAFAPGYSLLAGLRANQTHETRRVNDLDDAEREQTRDNRSRISGLLGLNAKLWSDGDGLDAVYGYVNYRNTFKPADVDFAARPESTLLAPQQGQSVELGLKGRGLDHNRFTWYATLYSSNVKNVVVEDEAAGILTSAGEEQFNGGEIDLRLRVLGAWTIAGEYTYTNARYKEYEIDGVDAAGNRIALTPIHEGSLGLIYAPACGLHGSLNGRLIGPRFLNAENEAELEAYVVGDASLGYRLRAFDVQLTASNLLDSRQPVARSEAGQGQYYRLPARRLSLRVTLPF